MKKLKLMEAVLNQFEGGTSAGGATAGDGGAASVSSGDAQAIPGNTRRGKDTGETNVVYGKQDAQPGSNATEPPDAGENNLEAQKSSNTLEERRKAYQALVNGEYKDIYTEDTQRIINRRFREAKQTEATLQAQQPVIDLLMERYRISNGDIATLKTAVENDGNFWADAAEAAGMTEDAYREYVRNKREKQALARELEDRKNREAAEKTLQKWYAEGEELKTIYPSFSLDAESANPQFVSLLKSGIPVKLAYEVIHKDDLVANASREAARKAEERVVQAVRANGVRPGENGTSSQSAFVVKDDVSKLSKKDRAEVVRRAARGEQIRF